MATDVTDWLSHVTKFVYNHNSDLIATTFPSESQDEDKYTYNNADRMSEAKMLKGTETLASLVYTRTGGGEVKKTVSSGLPGAETTEYTYDANSRLTKSGTSSYEYDAANDPTNVAGASYTYNSASQLETGPSLKYSYDELGERTKATPEAGPATTYRYDQAGDLTSVERPEGEGKPRIEDGYAYNGDGLRVSQTISGTTSYFAWDMTESVPLILSDGTNSYVYGSGGLPIEQINNGSGAVQYLHHDQAGST